MAPKHCLAVLVVNVVIVIIVVVPIVVENTLAVMHILCLDRKFDPHTIVVVRILLIIRNVELDTSLLVNGSGSDQVDCSGLFVGGTSSMSWTRRCAVSAHIVNCLVAQHTLDSFPVKANLLSIILVVLSALGNCIWPKSIL